MRDKYFSRSEFLSYFWIDGAGDMSKVADLVRRQLFLDDRRLVQVLEAVVGRVVVEVRNGAAALADEDVAGLDVHVHQAFGVDVTQPLGNVLDQPTQFRYAHRLARYAVLQRAAIAVLVLNDHVVVLGPGREVPHDVLVIT